MRTGSVLARGPMTEAALAIDDFRAVRMAPKIMTFSPCARASQSAHAANSNVFGVCPVSAQNDGSLACNSVPIFTVTRLKFVSRSEKMGGTSLLILGRQAGVSPGENRSRHSFFGAVQSCFSNHAR